MTPITTPCAAGKDVAEPPTAAAGLSLRILLAEDDREFRSLVASVLEAEGHEVVQLADGQALLQYISMSMFDDTVFGPVDMVITDIRMPGWTGLEVLTGARASGCSLPFIILTAFGDESTHRLAGRLNAIAVLDKPFDMDALRGAVRRAEATRRGAGSESPHRRRLHSLLAVNDPELRAVTSFALTGDGFDVLEMNDSSELLDFLQAQRAADADPTATDIIVTDIPLQGWSGLEVVEELRRTGWDVPFIAITGGRETAVRERARDRGISAFISRPFDIEDFRTILLNISIWRLARMYSVKHRP